MKEAANLGTPGTGRSHQCSRISWFRDGIRDHRRRPRSTIRSTLRSIDAEVITSQPSAPPTLLLKHLVATAHISEFRYPDARKLYRMYSNMQTSQAVHLHLLPLPSYTYSITIILQPLTERAGDACKRPAMTACFACLACLR